MGRLVGASPLPRPPGWVYAVSGVALFVGAINLLGLATGTFAPELERLFRRYVVDAPSALGASWLASYAVSNGSVVAAVAVTLFDAGIVSATELYLLVAGTRLGGAGVVVLIGVIDHAQNPRDTVRRSVGLGLLTFVLAFAVFIPAIPLGYLAVGRFERGRTPGTVADAGVSSIAPVGTVTGTVVDALGWLAFPLALVMLFAALQGFHRAFDRVDARALRERYLAYLNHRWMLFGLGALVTALTTSVAFSLGVVVPLYNRGTVTRREAIPYIMGANVATMSDTLLVAVLLGTPVAVAAVTVLVLVATALTLTALFWFAPFAGAVTAIQDGVVEDRRAFAVMATALLAAPLGLVVV